MTGKLALKISTPVPGVPVPILVVICGPTATGKSGLALNLAQRFNSIILSADSRQVYREFDIGTAKPTLAELQQVPHHLIDICEPTTTLTVADYQQQAESLIAMIHQKSVGPQGDGAAASLPLPLLVGGTGLYIRSVVRGLKIPRVAPQPELRSQLTTLGQPLCHAILQQVDPRSAEKIHPNDVVRTLRALEVYYVTGKPMAQQQGEFPPNYPILQIGLDCLTTPAGAEDPLTRRIHRRTKQMIAAGFVAEVATLCQKYGADLPLLNTLGYREVKQYLAGEVTLEEAIAQITLHTRQFAKRQRTWFRSDPTIQWFDADAPDLLEQVEQRITEFIRGCSQ